MKYKISYIWDENLIQQCDRLPAVIGRVSLNLITYYNVLDFLPLQLGKQF